MSCLFLLWWWFVFVWICMSSSYITNDLIHIFYLTIYYFYSSKIVELDRITPYCRLEGNKLERPFNSLESSQANELHMRVMEAFNHPQHKKAWDSAQEFILITAIEIHAISLSVCFWVDFFTFYFILFLMRSNTFPVQHPDSILWYILRTGR